MSPRSSDASSAAIERRRRPAVPDHRHRRRRPHRRIGGAGGAGDVAGRPRHRHRRARRAGECGRARRRHRDGRRRVGRVGGRSGGPVRAGGRQRGDAGDAGAAARAGRGRHRRRQHQARHRRRGRGARLRLVRRRPPAGRRRDLRDGVGARAPVPWPAVDPDAVGAKRPGCRGTSARLRGGARSDADGARRGRARSPDGLCEPPAAGRGLDAARDGRLDGGGERPRLVRPGPGGHDAAGGQPRRAVGGHPRRQRRSRRRGDDVARGGAGPAAGRARRHGVGRDDVRLRGAMAARHQAHR